MTGPLSGFRVVEIAEGLAGPQTGLMLADAGAEVIKIETPAGDRSRGWHPLAGSGAGAVFDSLNRNKRGVALDVAGPGAEDALLALVRSADILILDDQDGVPACLDYESLRKTAPQLIYCLISGWGAKGPWAGLPGGELPAQLASEWTTTTGAIGEPPVRTGADVASGHAASYAAQAVCAALLARLRGGTGQRIDVSLFGALISMRSKLWVTQSDPDDWGGYRLDCYVSPPDHGYECKDGRVLIRLMGGMDVQATIERVVDALDMGWVKDDPLWPKFRKDTPGGTGLYTEETRPLWERGLAKWTCSEVIDICRANGMLAFPFNDYSALVADDQVKHLGVVADFEGIPYVTSPWQFAETPVSIRAGPPRLGQHTVEALKDAGVTPQRIEALLASGVALQA